MLAVLATAIASHAFAGWTPPEKPDAQAILNEARADRAAGRFEDALAKHVWFHEKGLECAPAMYGVRTSFALADWHNLADKYPPAMAALLATRDRAAADAAQGRSMPDSFYDALAIHRELEDHAQAVTLFRLVERRDPELARRASHSVQDSFIETGDLASAGRYLDPDHEFRTLMESRKGLLRPNPSGVDMTPYVNRFYDNRAAKVVALLVHANRNAEALELARKVTDEVPSSKAAMQKALTGEMPEDLFPKAQRDWFRKVMP